MAEIVRIIENVKKGMLLLNEKYLVKADDKYDYWKEHIGLVVLESLRLAEKYRADLEIVELAAMYH